MHTKRLLGIKASDLHSWIDELHKSYGKDHRQFRHELNTKIPRWAIKKYGLRNCFLIHFIHLIDDGITQLKTPWYDSMSDEEKKELLKSPYYYETYNGTIMYNPSGGKKSGKDIL